VWQRAASCDDDGMKTRRSQALYYNMHLEKNAFFFINANAHVYTCMIYIGMCMGACMCENMYYNVPISVFKIKLRPYNYTTIQLYHYNDRVACLKKIIHHFLHIILTSARLKPKSL